MTGSAQEPLAVGLAAPVGAEAGRAELAPGQRGQVQLRHVVQLAHVGRLAAKDQQARSCRQAGVHTSDVSQRREPGGTSLGSVPRSQPSWRRICTCTAAGSQAPAAHCSTVPAAVLRPGGAACGGPPVAPGGVYCVCACSKRGSGTGPFCSTCMHGRIDGAAFSQCSRAAPSELEEAGCQHRHVVQQYLWQAATPAPRPGSAGQTPTAHSAPGLQSRCAPSARLQQGVEASNEALEPSGDAS